MNNRKKSAPRYSRRRMAAILLCLAGAALFGSLYLWQTWTAVQEEKANEQLAAQVAQLQPSAAGEEDGPEEARLAGYRTLWEQNRDLAGWLRIEGTSLDYPVMFTPNAPEYYLRRAFDGSSAVSGCLFIGGGCTPESSHVIIYGHNMKNETMFGLLPQYAAEEYAKEHPVICYDTLEELGEYEVLAAFYSRVYTDQDEGVFRYYQYTDLSDPKVLEEYVGQVRAAALYDTGVTAEYGDSLLTLSTCSGDSKDGRFVVVARRSG